MRIQEGNCNRWAPPPEGCVRFYNDVPNDIQILKEHGVYCKTCYTVSRDTGVLAGEREPEDVNKVHIFCWDFDLADLVETAEAGCHFCSIFASRYFTGSFMSSGRNGTRGNNVACCSEAPRWNKQPTEVVGKSLKELRKFLEHSPQAHFTFVAEPMDYSSADGSFGLVRFSGKSTRGIDGEAYNDLTIPLDIDLEFLSRKGMGTEKCLDSVASIRIKRQPLSTQAGSEEGLKQAKKWIQECFDEHEECPGPEESTLPRRIVKIRDEESLVLHENKSSTEAGTYVALSYCWRGPQEFALTTDSFDDKIKGFRMSDLPQSLQDAIFLTRRLGVEYIWIDALCIIQDSSEDKARELPEMARYYTNAHVTICAASAEKCRPDGEYDEILFRQPFPYNLAEEPIERRAWPFQERALSPRVLNYGMRTVWQCRHHQRSHGGVDDFSFDKRTFNFRHLLALSKQSNDNNDPANAPDALYDTWHQAVHAYSVRNLTFESDKLPAIAGLASVFAHAMGDEYLAGLWRSRLLRELLWSTSPKLHLQRPEKRRAPSWSWASTDNDITYERLPPISAKPIATIIKCTTTPLIASSTFAHNADGVLEIESTTKTPAPGHIVKKVLQAECRVSHMDPFSDLVNPAFWDNFFCGKRGGSNEWEAPEKCAFLPLFAEEKEDGEDGGEKSANGSREEEKHQQVGSEDGDGHEEEGEEHEEKGIRTWGLVLAERGDGTYELIADYARVELRGSDTYPRKRIVIV